MDFFHRHKIKLLIAGAVFGVGYLVIHFLIFDDHYNFTTVWRFILDGRHHIVHIAPVIIVFFILLGLTIRDKMRK